MVLSFTASLQKAIQEIESGEAGMQLPIHPSPKPRFNETIEVYGNAKWKIVDILNEKYSTILKDKFDLYNWLDYHEKDEVAYFLNEAGSNTLNYAEFKAPARFHLWLGKKGFVIGIEQEGKGFNAERIHTEKIKEGEGAAFEFYRKCKSTIFFDHSQDARIVYFEYIF